MRRDHLAEGAFPTEVERRLEHEGLARFLRTLLRTLVERDREVTRAVNLIAQVRTAEVGSVEGPAYAGAWIAGAVPLRAWRDGAGTVLLAGELDRSPRTPSIGETVTTLPVELRPAELAHARAFELVSPVTVQRLQIDTAGVVTWEGPATATAAAVTVAGFWRAAA